MCSLERTCTLLGGSTEEFFMANPDYFFIVGNPDSGKVERIGVSSNQLKAHSPVFRSKLKDLQQTDRPEDNLHISDVNPDTFKLMLRHIYGGDLPKLDEKEIIHLALFGKSYDINGLVDKVASQLKPSSAKNIIPALNFLSHNYCPTLEAEVCKIIQTETSSVVYDNTYLNIGEHSVLLIAKQDALNITEIELWKFLVRWGGNELKARQEKSLRNCLIKVLEHFRFLTLTVQEIVDHILPSNVLTPAEVGELFYAIIAKQDPLKAPGLCQIREKRKLLSNPVNETPKSLKFGVTPSSVSALKLKRQGGKKYSSFSIELLQQVTMSIDSFIIRNEEREPNSNLNRVYELQCYITMVKSSEGFPVEEYVVSITKPAAIMFDDVNLSIRLKNDQPLVLKGPGRYFFNISFNIPITVYEIYKMDSSNKEQNVTFEKHQYPSEMYVRYEDQPHVIGIVFKTRPTPK
ncbi:BTB/POZ domain-containing protein 6-B-like isoform X1 [Macrosteles quadrilineatus]|uniref:BTB/POZ domain-containing protein 6-B-like isoform X1 n=2 Tax=Macrosteles quadrilineatus TaxID=74068 RepID=UPI0023E1AD67|nr:BTB/POZ domain-containing protein 6-B-like isoform X1 [Macrosteles quadrilineatus]